MRLLPNLPIAVGQDRGHCQSRRCSYLSVAKMVYKPRHRTFLGGNCHEALHASGIDDEPAGAAVHRGKQNSGRRGDSRPVHRRTLWTAYTAVNPNNLVPMIEDGDLRLTESSAILKYLADKIGSPAYPKDLKQRAKVNEMMDWLNTNFYRDWAYNLCYPQLFPNQKRRSDEAQAATIETRPAKRQALAENPQRPLDRPEETISVRRPDHHRRLFRRCAGDARRSRPLRLLSLSECRALAQQREEAAELGAGQRGVPWPGRFGERAAFPRHLTKRRYSGDEPTGPARSGRPDDRLREEPGIHIHRRPNFVWTFGNLTFRDYGFRARGLRPRPGMTHSIREIPCA